MITKKVFGKTLSNQSIIIVLPILIFSLLLVIYLYGCFSMKNALVINEYMHNNRSTMYDEEVTFPAWVELYNKGAEPLNLKGYALSCSGEEGIYWKFPDIIIRGEDFLVIFISGKDRVIYNKKANRTYIHTNFTIDGNDITLHLLDPHGHRIDEIEITDSQRDTSCGRVGEGDDVHWKVCEAPTPGFENNIPGHEKFIREKEELKPAVCLNEVMASNMTTLINDDGEFADWIEIHNSSDEYISLRHYGLSDDRKKPAKWVFPDVTILPGQYLLVFASGKNPQDENHTYLHTNFKLNAKKDLLIFSDPDGFILDRVTIKNHGDDISYGRDEAGSSEWIFFTEPTPGFENHIPDTTARVSGGNTSFQGVYISEVIPYGCDQKKDEDGDISDIIEIHNKNTFSVNMKGYYLTDNSLNPYKWAFPEIFMKPDTYLIVFTSGKDRRHRYLHANFKVGSDENEILLVHKTAGVIDTIPVLPGSFNMSYGRTIDDTQLLFFLSPTPGKANETGYKGIAGDVEVSLSGGYFSEPQYVEIRGDVDDICYTLDGSEPRSTSSVYTSPLYIDKTTVLRARGFRQGLLPGKITTASFFFNITHELPVLSLVTDPSHLWDTDSGIFVKENLKKKWERPIHIEFFENDGSLGFCIDAGMRLFGHSSRFMQQTPFYIITRKRYGERTIQYRIFPDKDIQIFKSILVRNAGEDGSYSRIRDAVTTTLVRRLGIDAQASRPVVLYINGRYWGHYNIRDKIDENFLAYHHDIHNPADIDLIEGNRRVMAGNYTAYQSIFDYVSSHDVKNQDVYDYIATQIDLENLITYEIAQIYFANTDMGNVRFWRERSQAGKWRWILFDTDWTFHVIERDSFKWNFNPVGRGYLKFFSTLFITKLLTNESFKQRFLNRFTYLMSTTFSAGNVSALIEKITATIESEMPVHCRRWETSIDEWKKQVKWLLKFARERPAYVYKHFKQYFKLSDDDFKRLSDCYM